MLKYYLNGQEISSIEYEECIIDDAYDSGEPKSTAMRVIQENRQEARTSGENTWTLADGSALVIERI